MTDRHRLGPSSQAALPMDHDDLLCEILLRLPPLPSSLPRVSLVCKRWRRLLSDPAFHRRFRIHHRGNPPLLGFFSYSSSFRTTLEAPDRVPSKPFSFQLGGPFVPLGCRHGLLLILVISDKRQHEVLVRDPVTAHQHRIVIPPGFDATKTLIHGEVLLTAGDVNCFQVVLVVACNDDKQCRRAIACVYSSKTGAWGDIISILLPSKYPMDNHYIMSSTCKPAVLVGSSLYWMLPGNHNPIGILKFDLEKMRLDLIELPMDMFENKKYEFWVMRAEGGGIGFLLVSEPDLSIQLWKRKTDCGGVASWVLGRTIEIDKLLSMNPEEKGHLLMLGLAENNNVVFLSIAMSLFMVQLKTLQFKKLFESDVWYEVHPFESVYTTGIP